MEFEWDERKNAETLVKRGIDFNQAIRIFRGPVLRRIDRRRDYGEIRIVATGRVDHDILVVVYTDRGRRRRIISARPANRRERDAYRSTYP